MAWLGRCASVRVTASQAPSARGVRGGGQQVVEPAAQHRERAVDRGGHEVGALQPVGAELDQPASPSSRPASEKE